MVISSVLECQRKRMRKFRFTFYKRIISSPLSCLIKTSVGDGFGADFDRFADFDLGGDFDGLLFALFAGVFAAAFDFGTFFGVVFGADLVGVLNAVFDGVFDGVFDDLDVDVVILMPVSGP